jgi:hypothetical protein
MRQFNCRQNLLRKRSTLMTISPHAALKFNLGVRSAKDGKSGAWSWSLPPTGEQE